MLHTFLDAIHYKPHHVCFSAIRAHEGWYPTDSINAIPSQEGDGRLACQQLAATERTRTARTFGFSNHLFPSLLRRSIRGDDEDTVLARVDANHGMERSSSGEKPEDEAVRHSPMTVDTSRNLPQRVWAARAHRRGFSLPLESMAFGPRFPASSGPRVFPRRPDSDDGPLRKRGARIRLPARGAGAGIRGAPPDSQAPRPAREAGLARWNL